MSNPTPSNPSASERAAVAAEDGTMTLVMRVTNYKGLVRLFHGDTLIASFFDYNVDGKALMEAARASTCVPTPSQASERPAAGDEWTDVLVKLPPRGSAVEIAHAEAGPHEAIVWRLLPAASLSPAVEGDASRPRIESNFHTSASNERNGGASFKAGDAIGVQAELKAFRDKYADGRAWDREMWSLVESLASRIASPASPDAEGELVARVLTNLRDRLVQAAKFNANHMLSPNGYVSVDYLRTCVREAIAAAPPISVPRADVPEDEMWFRAGATIYTTRDERTGRGQHCRVNDIVFRVEAHGGEERAELVAERIHAAIIAAARAASAEATKTDGGDA